MFAKISFDPNVSQSKHLIATYVFLALQTFHMTNVLYF